MRVLVLGGDGYLGWPTALGLAAAGHHVGLVDSFARRGYDAELGTDSLVPIPPLAQRVQAWHEHTGTGLPVFVGDLVDPDFVYDTVERFGPDAVVHFAEQRSAPYSMIDRAHAVHTQQVNVTGTLNLLYAIAEIDPRIHLVKLGSMGEYGTPNLDIEEGWLEITHRGRRDRVLYPKRPGSMYHLSKVHDSHNIEFACRVWGLAATDLNQGVVYGHHTPAAATGGTDPRLATRFDYDAVFGTVLNRFVVQAVIGQPLSVYGTGEQTRGIINLRDSVECIRLACEHPAAPGEFRVFNQLTETYSVAELARRVAAAYPHPATVEYRSNPRAEAETHHYQVAATGLPALGLEPHLLDDTLLHDLFGLVERHRDRIDPAALPPEVDWAAGPARRADRSTFADTIAAPPTPRDVPTVSQP